MSESYTFTVNGVSRTTHKEEPLLRYLRDELRLTSVKDGCSEGACGTCTILVDGRAVRACILTTKKAVGKSIVTVEGLSPEEQEAFVYAFGAVGAVQCGFCIPGMVLSGKALLDVNPNPTADEAYKVFFYSMNNDTIPAAFQSGDAKICCCYSPSTTTIRNSGGVKVATAASHMPDYTYINTWVANSSWLENNPDVAQRFINALIKAMDYRSSHEEEAADMAEEVCEAAKDSFYCEDYIVYSAQDLSDYMDGFDEGTGYAYELMKLLYDEKVGNVESGNPRSLAESCNFSFMETALETYLGK